MTTVMLNGFQVQQLLGACDHNATAMVAVEEVSGGVFKYSANGRIWLDLPATPEAMRAQWHASRPVQREANAVVQTTLSPLAPLLSPGHYHALPPDYKDMQQ